jgi:hypothetical protein
MHALNAFEKELPTEGNFVIDLYSENRQQNIFVERK